HRRGIKTCGDLQKWSEIDLHRCFGRFGSELYRLSRGQDDREVNPHRERKSVSNERTFRENIEHVDEGLLRLDELIGELFVDLQKHKDRTIREGFVKLKFNDFTITSAQVPMTNPDPETYRTLLREAWNRGNGKSVRLIGAGVRFVPEDEADEVQLEMF
ncbi:MAG: hypothetical protein P1V20_21180, partial [Verrucomicrobiales bacterium]|nr:hypothetical protein [Verrucomicrobiales bacterium]